MKLKEILNHIVFGLIVSGIFGLLAFVILLLPIFFNCTILEIILRVCAFTIVELVLFIGGVRFSINYNPNDYEIGSLTKSE